MIKAEIIADSLNEFGNRITTFRATFPRIVLAEYNTHRMFSRNSASSRAIPFEKMVEAVQTNPFIPLKWMKDHKGMQGSSYVESAVSMQRRVDQWLTGRDLAVYAATKLHEPLESVFDKDSYPFFYEDEEPITKQMCNRQLETYMWHTAITTATEFENFYALRFDGAAEIHISKLAEEMLIAQNASVPKRLKGGEWHIPYGDQIDSKDLMHPGKFGDEQMELVLKDRLKIATARCAQVSYTIIGEDGKPMDYLKLIALHDRLAKAGHWSPFEHCAKDMSEDEYVRHIFGVAGWEEAGGGFSSLRVDQDTKGWCGNFRGFIQYRKTFENENRSDSRLIKA